VLYVSLLIYTYPVDMNVFPQYLGQVYRDTAWPSNIAIKNTLPVYTTWDVLSTSKHT